MLLTTIFVEFRVVAGRSRKRAGSPQAVSRQPCCAVALRRTAWSEHGMASVNQTRLHSVNQMEKTHSKPLAARYGHGMLCVNRPLVYLGVIVRLHMQIGRITLVGYVCTSVTCGFAGVKLSVCKVLVGLTH